MRALVCTEEKPKILHPVHPNEGVMAGYRAKMDALISRLHNSIMREIIAQYREAPPVLAQDSPASDFVATLRGLSRRWLSQFSKAGKEMSVWFANSTSGRADASLKAILRDAGWTVQFKSTKAWNDVRQATIAQNVSLIKSIASEHLTQVEVLVMESVQRGGDLATLTDKLEQRYGISRRRAELIARDQNNKATAAITRVRHQELGIKQAIWVHSAAGREPRPDHVAYAAGRLGGPLYDVDKGAPLADNPKGGPTWPGVEINCRCISRPIIPGLSKQPKFITEADHQRSSVPIYQR